MKNLIIIGARGFGREVYNTALESLGFGESFEVKGFLDDKSDALDGYNGYPPIISSVEEYTPQLDDVFICALGEVKWKKYYSQKILEKGGKFITLIHKQAYISKNVKLGVGCIILAGARIHCDVKIGNFVILQPYAIIGHDVTIEDWCMINAYADCGGASYLEEGATLHTHSFLHPKKRLGSYAILGACSFATRNVKSSTVVIGVPAKELPLPKI